MNWDRCEQKKCRRVAKWAVMGDDFVKACDEHLPALIRANREWGVQNFGSLDFDVGELQVVNFDLKTDYFPKTSKPNPKCS